MNTLLLLAIVLFVFVMGYRYYAKFLALAVFRINKDASTPALRRADEHDLVATERWILFSNIIAGFGILSVLGVAVGVIWGWIPAFLWVVAGSLVAGGTFALASLWSSLRRSGDSLAGIVYDQTGIWGAFPMYLLGVIVLLCLCALMSVLLGQLLQAHPEATWSFLCLVIAPFVLRRGFGTQANPTLLIWLNAGIVLFIAGILLGQWLPLSATGIWRFHLGSVEILNLSNELIWATVALVLAYKSIKAPVNLVAQPRGAFMGVLLILLVLLVVIGLILTPSPLVAPDFQLDDDLPSVFPLLFLAITGGAISGVYALIMTGPVVRQIKQQKDVPMLGYGSMLTVGVLGVVVLLVLCAGFTTQEEWLSFYSVWPDQASLYAWLDIAVVKLARFVAVVGIPYSLAVAAVAAVFAGLTLIMLEYALRTLAYAVEEFVEDFELTTLFSPHYRERLAVGFVAIAALWLFQADLELKHWLVFGVANQLFAGIFLMVLTLILLRIARNALFSFVPALFSLVFAIWGLIWLLIDWWQKQEWLLFLLACLIGVIAIISLTACVSAILKVRQQQASAIPLARASR
ncbi:MAG: carbon starvation CstA family protein [Arenicellales bacterium]|nr:carbon starvation CstA family protein [Arenicellales bacterium]